MLLSTIDAILLMTLRDNEQFYEQSVRQPEQWEMFNNYESAYLQQLVSFLIGLL
ncbi:MAG: hypothetical protein HC769_14010 [Cyanobacteria bacterium CRU_2_1]|nr:hypothetical protein [Cyanobacteria bacterium CRU_2_1]